jgi:hypothetical protein
MRQGQSMNVTGDSHKILGISVLRIACCTCDYCGNIAGRPSTVDSMYSSRPVGKHDHHPEMADLLSLQEVAIKSLLGRIIFL